MGHDAGDLVTVATFTGLDEAGIARGVLESEGIETFVQNEHLVAIAWTLSQATGGVSLAVAKEDAEEARELLGNDEPLRLAGGNPDDADAAGPGDLLAERAWKSALVGFLGI